MGLPNSGKSTLLSVLTDAKPKIANYEFTTLKPNLGIVNHRDFNTFVISDIPGIIEGAWVQQQDHMGHRRGGGIFQHEQPHGIRSGHAAQ